MADPSYILFNKSLLQCRSLGARGGRAYGRNQRARRALLLKLPEAVPPRAAPQETTAKAIVLLDAQFPWLRCAQKRLARRAPGKQLRTVLPHAPERRGCGRDGKHAEERTPWTLTRR
jgi:hypothetical protein